MQNIFYEITESFPSITPNKIDIGIIKANYEIALKNVNTVGKNK